MVADAGSRFDVIVAGGGHNGLVSAAYLATAGLDVLLIEDRDIVGGNAVTEEHVPGFRFDTGASGHVFIQATDLLKKDELGLLANGLRYEFPDPVQTVMLSDGSLLQVHREVDATAKEIAGVSPRDADAYLLFEDEARDFMESAALVERSVPDSCSVPDSITRRFARRAWDIIEQRFEDPRIQAWMCQESSIVMVPPDQPWTARFLYGSYVSRHTADSAWGTPMGGSGVLTEGLRAVIESRGGSVRVGHRVSRVLVEDGRAVGVECDNGATFYADKAVVSSIHIKHLVDMVPRSLWPEDTLEAIEDYVTGPAIGVSYIAATEAPRYRGKDGRESVTMAALMTSTLEDALGWGSRMLLKRPSLESGMMFTHTGTVMDPDRSPAGGHTIKCVSWQSYDPGGGAEKWDALRDDLEAFHLRTLKRHAPNITGEKIIGTVTRTPLDLERANLHNVGGSAHGGEQLASQLWGRRPAPGWAHHRMPIPGLYQTGATTHPGGGITGVSGRNAAAAVLADLGTSLDDQVVSGVLSR